MTSPQPSILIRKQMEAAIIARAWSDQAFRELLLSDPRKAVAEMGFDVPEGFSVSVTEEKADTIEIVLPTKPDDADELSEASLQRIAGGFWRGVM